METIRIAGTLLQNEAGFARQEWLSTNGIGGFAGSTLVGANARGYHGILVAALRPPLERVLLVSKLDESVIVNGEKLALGTNIYQDEVYPKGYQYLASFRYTFHPTFTYCFKGRVLEKKVYMVYGENTTVVEYFYADGQEALTLQLTPHLNYRDYHGNIRAKDAQSWPWDVEITDHRYRFTAFEGAQPIYLLARGQWMEKRQWALEFFYPIEEYRGLKAVEDHYIPGVLETVLQPGEKLTVVFSTAGKYTGAEDWGKIYAAQIERVERLFREAGARDPLTRRLVMAADQFVVHRESTNTATVIAGYPWFTDWGRDSMIALPGLTLATRRWQEGKEILETFARYSRHGLIPNRFPDAGEEPEYNTVDASLWFFVAMYEYYRQSNNQQFIREHLPLLREMLDYHTKGTLWKIAMDSDGLLTQGEKGVQLTWMDAKVGDWVVTPRQGKAVEINALWYNAVKIFIYLTQVVGEGDTGEYDKLAGQIFTSFQKFWNADGGYLADRLDEDGLQDLTIRPNQLLALSLPFPLVGLEQGAAILRVVQKHLLTPHGLRSLSATDPAYHGVYGGDQYHRDAAYHQGTVWAWLLGPYLGALLYVEGNTPATREKVLALMEPLAAHMLTDGAIGQISEIFDGDQPYHHRGCYAQAWSVAELLRIKELIGAF